MGKDIIRLTESDLREAVMQTVRAILEDSGRLSRKVYGEVHYYDAKGNQYRLDCLAQDLRNMGVKVTGTGFNDDYDGYIEVEVNLEQAKMLDDKFGSKFDLFGRGSSVEERYANALKSYDLFYKRN